MARHAEEPYDIFFYQIEDSPECDFVRRQMLLAPGVVYFHDILFRPREDNLAGEKLVQDAELRISPFLNEGASTVPDHTAFAAREARFAAVPIFSNERNWGEYSRHCPSSLAAVLGLDPAAYLLPCPAGSSKSKERARASAGERLRVGFAGGPQLEYRAHKLCAALRQSGIAFDLVWLIDEDVLAAGKRLADEFELGNVEFISPRNFAQWERCAAGLDVAVHLLGSVYGDAQPWLSISMSSGCLCAVSDFSAAALLPDAVVWKIPCGEGEITSLVSMFQTAVSDAESNRRRTLQSNAAAYAAQHFSASVSAAELACVFWRSAAPLRKFLEQ
ncbi:MAG TPA: hypothetical protein PLP17_17385, partial [Oligoflexia bacterium]|nr:hypothetical protein [Oligoflexia bacterium]